MVSTPLEKYEFVSWDDEIPNNDVSQYIQYMESHKSHVPNHQSDYNNLLLSIGLIINSDISIIHQHMFGFPISPSAVHMSLFARPASEMSKVCSFGALRRTCLKRASSDWQRLHSWAPNCQMSVPSGYLLHSHGKWP